MRPCRGELGLTLSAPRHQQVLDQYMSEDVNSELVPTKHVGIHWMTQMAEKTRSENERAQSKLAPSPKATFTKSSFI